MPTYSPRNLLANIGWALVLGILSVALLAGFNRLAAPPAKLPPLGGVAPPDYAQLLDDINPDSLHADLTWLTEHQSRFTGSHGADHTADTLAATLRDLGYTVFEQPLDVAIPVTHWADLTLVSNDSPPADAASGVRLAPMLPNWFRTATTPPDGLVGHLVRGELGLSYEFEDRDIDGAIVVLPLGRPWHTVAAMGAVAVLYVDDDERGVDLGHAWAHSVPASVNVPRFLVEDDLSAWIGQTVRLRARVDIETRRVRNIVGILEGPPDADEILVLGAHYDAHSYVPDHSPGASQACSAAAWLAAVRRLAAERDAVRRHVVVAATAAQAYGLEGARALARVIGGRDRRREALETLRETMSRRDRDLERARAVAAVADDPLYWQATGIEAETAYWRARDPDTRTAFENLLVEVFNQDLMIQLDVEVTAQVNWVRAGMPVVDDQGGEAPLFTRYNENRLAGRRLLQVIRTPPGAAKELQDGAVFAQRAIAERMTEAARTAVTRAEQRQAVARAELDLAQAIPDAQRILYLGLDLTPADARVTMISGISELASRTVPADAEIYGQLIEAGHGLDHVVADPEQQVYVQGAGGRRTAVNLVREGDETRLSFAHRATLLYFTSQPFLWHGHGAFMFVTAADNRRRMGTPFDTLERLLAPAAVDTDTPLERLAQATRLTTAAVLRLAHGFGTLLPVQLADDTQTLRGRVVSRVGDDLTPNHPMPGAMVRIGPLQQWGNPINPPPGGGYNLWQIADEDGWFTYEAIWGGAISTGWRWPVSFDAAVADPRNGDITWTLNERDSGLNQQFSVREVPIETMAKSLVMPVVFRCQPVEVVPMSDPANLRPYAAMGILDAQTISQPIDFKSEIGPNLRVFYVPPHVSLFFTFRKGSFRNPNLTSVRAFALGAEGPPDGAHLDGYPELWGHGFLAADHPRIRNIEFDAAVSMNQVNSRRLALLERHDMADAMTVAFHDQALAKNEAALEQIEQHQIVAARQAAQDAIAYAQNVHPVVRETISDAVIGILFYLILAAPFAIFAEKLFFGYPDIRWQLAAQSGFFLAFFVALRFLHPAYQLVRSSFMILLGFATFALAAFVAAFVAARFRQNLTELRRRVRDEADVSDVSRAGAAAAAFVLGLGHMRRRKVRTGLTVGTLVLTVFVMLSFTSVRTDMVDIEFALGRAPYTGLLVRDANFNNVADSVDPLQERYGREHVVAPRRWVGSFQVGANRAAQRQIIDLTHLAGERRVRAEVNAVLGLDVREPELTAITNAFDLATRWFENNHEFVCFLPNTIAGALQISVPAILAGEAVVRLSGQDYQVLGTFDPHALETLVDVDGQSILPLDVLSLMTMELQSTAARDEATDVPPDVDRLPGDAVVITPREAVPGGAMVASVAVGFRGLDYRVARDRIVSHLERSGEPAFYGLDGVAYYGGRFRRRSLTGLLDLIIPLIVAALAVLNTMRGSVYERRDELFVFNAVGLSPRHIVALFLAEGSVYAVMGAVGGYLLAQSVTALLNAFNLTGGLTMNYASLSSIGVTVVVMACVYLSSLFPARMASRLAAPAETLVRKRASAEGDVIELDLPFMFNRRDRIALVAYFIDWFEDYGEGSSGAFICDPPACGVRPDGDASHAAPFVRTTVWLKPYDLGVSQRVEVTSRRAPDGKGIVATVTMTRLSGDLRSWERCCHAFIGLLRKRFLTWRAIPDALRDRLMHRGRQALEQALAGAAPQPPAGHGRSEDHG